MTCLPLIVADTLASLGAVAGAQQPLGPERYPKPGAFDMLAVLPPAPKPTDSRGVADRAIFKTTRAHEGSLRWTMASSDVKLTPADLFRDFSCAMGT